MIGTIIAWIAVGVGAVLLLGCTLAPFVLSGRISEQEERYEASCPSDPRDCPTRCQGCEALADYELETYRATEARAE